MLETDKLAAAKLWLISPPNPQLGDDGPRDMPYLSQALFALIPVESAEVKKMTSDEFWRVYINPEFLNAASVQEVATELAHTTWHLLADHANRSRDQGVDRSTASAWQKASDATVVHTLAPDHLKPKSLASANDLGLPPGRSAEEYFASISLLPAGSGNGASENSELEPDQGCGSGADGLPRRHEYGPETDIGEVRTSHAQEIRKQVAISFQGHKGARGKMPGEWLRFVKHTLEPTIAWEPILAGAVRRAVGWAAGRGDYTYSRPSRRASSMPNVVLPGQHRPVPRVSILVDTSASVDDQLLRRALGEVDAALLALGVAASSTTVYSVDSAVHNIQKVRRAADVKLLGGGGTDMRVGLQAIEKERPRPDVVVVFTDGDTGWPASPPPGSAVIAALLGRADETLPPTPTWVTRIECRLDEL